MSHRGDGPNLQSETVRNQDGRRDTCGWIHKFYNLDEKRPKK